MSSLRLTDVFGIQRREPRNYVERNKIDEKLIYNLHKKKYIVIHGANKQGKTSLCYHNLDASEYIEINCKYVTSIAQLNREILKSIGFEIEISNNKTVDGNRTLRVKSKQQLSGIRSGGISSDTKEALPNETTTTLDVDPDELTDVISAINQLNPDKQVILDDFHYLSAAVQQEFVRCLTALRQRTRLTIIIAGTWLEENKLGTDNDSFGNRVISINVDEWEHDELRSVIEAGEKELQITFDDEFKNELLEECYGSVEIVQNVCLKACEIEGVRKPQPETDAVVVGEKLDPVELIEQVVNKQDGKYRAFLRKFASGFRENKTALSKWIVYSVISTDPETLQQGVAVSEIVEHINAKQSEIDAVEQETVTQLLERIAKLQIESKIKPIVVDYNTTDTRLDIVDKRFLIWLDTKSQSELRQLINVE